MPVATRSSGEEVRALTIMGRGQGKAKGKDFDNLKQELELDVHKVQPEELFRRFNTHRENGLSASQAKANLEKHGPNELTP